VSLWWAAVSFYVEPLLLIGFACLVAVILARVITGGNRL
jgi:hypothetical protein